MRWTPEGLLLRALDFKSRLAYDGVVSLCDPASLQEWFDGYLELMRPPTKSELRVTFSHFPEEKQPALINAMLARTAKLHSQIPRALPGTASYAELLALSTAEYARRSLEANDTRCMLVRGLRRKGRDVPPEMFDPPVGWGHRVLRTEVRSEGEVRVFYTDTYRGEDLDGSDDPEFEELRQLEWGEWRLIPHSSLLRRRISVEILDQEALDLIED